METRTEAPLIALNNMNPCVIQLAGYVPHGDPLPGTEHAVAMGGAPVRQHKVRTVPLLPGLNLKSVAELEGVAFDNAACQALRVRQIDLGSLESYAAIELAQQSCSRKDLMAWMAYEPRAEIKDAIRERLAKIRSDNDKPPSPIDLAKAARL